ncbi:MAG: DUF1836 domain-containing protein [Anaerovoracaceae bacterium]|jgi:hypothetical protein
MRYEEYLKLKIEELAAEGFIPLERFPDLDIYMDQAAAFMNEELKIYKKKKNDQVITKTMIGNYVKHKMLPRPENKKYTRDHMVLLTIIYYLKGSFQMGEIEKLMKPLISNYNSEFDDKINLMSIYEGLSTLQETELQSLLSDTKEDIKTIKHHLSEAELSDDDMVELFMLIVNLAIKADAQKYLAQKLLQEYFMSPEKGG